jgi:glycosyltransferase involved in cell wall biosynthesis
MSVSNSRLIFDRKDYQLNNFRQEGGLRTKVKRNNLNSDCQTLSLITVVFNGASTLEHTIRSFLEQTYRNLEFIVVDGGSTDGTLDILREYDEHIDYWVSEKDAGIYDAMNKGIALASGSIIGFINSDDFYVSSNVLANVAKVFANKSVDVCYGDLCYVKQFDTLKVVRYWKSSDFSLNSFEMGWCPPHPTFFVRREIYERYGMFDLSFKIAADVELMMRFLEVHRVCARYIPVLLVKMRMGGTTNRSLSNILKQNKEILRALKSHGLRSSIVRLMGKKLISRGLQFFIGPTQV